MSPGPQPPSSWRGRWGEPSPGPAGSGCLVCRPRPDRPGWPGSPVAWRSRAPWGGRACPAPGCRAPWPGTRRQRPRRALGPGDRPARPDSPDCPLCRDPECRDGRSRHWSPVIRTLHETWPAPPPPDLAWEHGVQCECWPHEHPQVQQRPHRGLETHGEPQPGQQRTQVTEHRARGEATVLAEADLEQEERPPEYDQHHGVHQEEGDAPVLHHSNRQHPQTWHGTLSQVTTQTHTRHSPCRDRVNEVVAPRKSEPRGHLSLLTLGLRRVAWDPLWLSVTAWSLARYWWPSEGTHTCRS